MLPFGNGIDASADFMLLQNPLSLAFNVAVTSSVPFALEFSTTDSHSRRACVTNVSRCCNCCVFPESWEFPLSAFGLSTAACSSPFYFLSCAGIAAVPPSSAHLSPAWLGLFEPVPFLIPSASHFVVQVMPLSLKPSLSFNHTSKASNRASPSA